MPCPPGLGPIPELELELPSIPIQELLRIRIARSGIGIKRCNWNRIEDAISILRFLNIHLKFIPPTATTSFKTNFQLDHGYIP